MCAENPVLKEGDIDFECTNKDHHQICLEKDKRNTYLKAKNSLRTPRISSFKYVFIVLK